MTETPYKKYNVEIWAEVGNENTLTLYSDVLCYVKISEIIYDTLMYLADKSSDKSKPYMDRWIEAKYTRENARRIYNDTESYKTELEEAMKQLSLLLYSNALVYDESFARLGNVDVHVLIEPKGEK